MATCSSVRIDLLGDRGSSGAWAGEIWQSGISVTASGSGGNFGNAIRQPLPTFQATAVGEQESGVSWDVYYAWQGDTAFDRPQQGDIVDDTIAFWNGFKSLCPTDMRLVGVRLSAILPNGKIFAGSNYFYLNTPSPGGSVATQQLPPQCAVVMSLRTGARGPGGRGRMYLPTTGITLSSGKLGSTNRNTLAATGKAYLEALHYEGVTPSVVNQKAQTYSSITYISIGDEIDTQRKRRNAVPEQYTDANLSYA